MEDHSWKSIIFGAGASIILLLVTYFFVTSKTVDFLNRGAPERVIEFTKPHVVGRCGMQKDWELTAQAGWSTRNQDTTTLTGVTNGLVFEKNTPTIRKLFADEVKISRISNQVEANGSPLQAEIDLHRATQQKSNRRPKFAKLSAAQIKYSNSDKISEVFGGVRIIDGKITIRADYMRVNHRDKTAVINKNVWATKGQLTLFCNEMQARPTDEEYDAYGNVRITLVKGKEVTRITADRAIFKQKDKELVEIYGNVKIVHPRRVAAADAAIYDEKSKVMTLHGNIQTVFEKAENYLTPKTLANLDNPDARKILKDKIYLTSKEMTIFTESDDALASGEVLVTQNTQEARANSAWYRDSEEKLYLSGNASLKKENKWIGADKVVIYIPDEIFEAVGSVRTRFILKK
ncbi:MAG: LptA/OstA family protein [Candidatus Margulisiibacteriota bacterium]